MTPFAYLLQLAIMENTDIYPTKAVSNENIKHIVPVAESSTARQTTSGSIFINVSRFQVLMSI